MVQVYNVIRSVQNIQPFSFLDTRMFNEIIVLSSPTLSDVKPDRQWRILDFASGRNESVLSSGRSFERMPYLRHLCLPHYLQT